MRKLIPLALTLLVAAPARADEPIAELAADAPIAAYGGWAAWSTEGGDGRYRLSLRAPDGTVSTARIAPQRTPFDVALGPDVDARVNVVYVRDGDVRRYVVSTRRDEALPSVSSPRYAEGSPAIYGQAVAFTRSIADCDVPYVKTLGSRAPSRRLLRGRCLRVEPGHLAVRGTRVVTSGVAFSDDAAQTSEIRVYSTRGGSKVVARASWGEEPNLFGQVTLDESFVSSVRHGIGAFPSFLRVKYTGGTVFETRANLSLTGAFAKSSSGTALYVEPQDDEGDECVSVPCRLVRAPRSPFGRAVRPLPPQLTVGYAGEPRQSRPLTFRGRLGRKIVQDGRTIRTEPLANVPVELRRRTKDESFEPTPYRAVTDAGGNYEIVVPPPVPREPWFTAVASTPGVVTWAGRGTVGTASP